MTSPLDVLRTRLQSDFYHSGLKASRSATGSQQQAPLSSSRSLYRSSVYHFRETFEILFSIQRVEGWRGLFKGLGPSLTGVVPATAIKFYAYGNCKRLLPQVLECEKDATLVHILSAATAGIVTGTATNPIWLVKTRLQLDRSHMRDGGAMNVPRYKSSIDCIRQVLRDEGFKGLYRGLAASYLGVIETSLHLTLYERMKTSLAQQSGHGDNTEPKKEAHGIALSGAAGLSKLLAVFVAYPHEVKYTAFSFSRFS